MLREFMQQRTPQQKKEIMARIRAFPICSMTCRVSSNISYFKSFIGRDFKAFMQMALFVLKPYFTEPAEEHCWFLLSKVSFCCDVIVIIVMFIDISSGILCLFPSMMKLIGELFVMISLLQQLIMCQVIQSV